MELQIGSYFLPEFWKHCLLFSCFQICCWEVCFLLILSPLNMASMCSLETFRIFPLSSVLCYFQFRDVCLKCFYDNFLSSILSLLFPEPLLLDVGPSTGSLIFLCCFFFFFSSAFSCSSFKESSWTLSSGSGLGFYFRSRILSFRELFHIL